VNRNREENIRTPPGGSIDPCDSPDFGGFTYDRRR